MKRIITADKVIAMLIKWGNNADDSRNMVAKHFDAAMTNNPEGTCREIANFIRTVY